MQNMIDAIFKLGPWLVRPLITFAIALAAGYLVRVFIFHWLRAWAKRTPSHIDDIIIAAFGAPARLWVLMLALDLAAKSSTLSEHTVENIDKGLLILWVLSLTIAASNLATNLFRHYGENVKGAAPVTTLAQNLIRIVVASIGTLVILNAFGVSITPILTALGVGGLAVALGMQETLANLFAGFFVSVAGNVRVGDYIKLSTGEEGYVTDVSWRATTLTMLAGNVIIIPNSKLAQANVTNFNLPARSMSVLLQVNVSYDCDPDAVEKVLLDETVRAVGAIPGLRAEPAPIVRLIPGFGDFALGFTVIVSVDDFVAQYPVQHELRKRIFKRLAREGIRIPFPTRTLYMREPHEGAGKTTL
jgi:small-conductance mechanosensitive channel